LVIMYRYGVEAAEKPDNTSNEQWPTSDAEEMLLPASTLVFVSFSQYE
jgi:hypothetical protein